LFPTLASISLTWDVTKIYSRTILAK